MLEAVESVVETTTTLLAGFASSVEGSCGCCCGQVLGANTGVVQGWASFEALWRKKTRLQKHIKNLFFPPFLVFYRPSRARPPWLRW